MDWLQGTPAESKSSLEYTYMRLLEQRIAQLEAVIEKGVTNPAEKVDENDCRGVR